jgi:ATP phosphoribosyltransferase
MKKINIVLPDGSMMDKITALFSRAGMPITANNQRTKEASVDCEFIGKIIFQRPPEIPQYVAGGLFDIGFVGQDWLAESDLDLPVLLKLPIGRKTNNPVKIALAAENSRGFNNVTDLPRDCRVATEYLNLAQKFFCEKGRPDIKVFRSYGNTEHKIGLGLAEAIVDVVESGESLRENRLEIVCEVMRSNVVIVANVDSLADKSKEPYLKCFAKLIGGAFQASKYVMLTANVPKTVFGKACAIMKGLKGPTYSPLAETGWFALQSIVPRKKEQTAINDLLQIGVTDIIVNRDIPLVME